MNLNTRSTRLRLASLLIGALALLLLAGCGSSKDQKGESTAPTTKLSTTIDLKVENGKFDKSAVTAKPGTIKITVSVPSTATGKHGVGINGGLYKNIKGAPVAPGRSTSLTVAVKAGTKYTIFDSYKDNKNKGYTTALTVK